MIANQSKLDFSPVDSAMMRFDREEAFKELRNELKTYRPDAKLIYAYIGDDLSRSRILEMMSAKSSRNADRIIQIDYALVYAITYRGNQRLVWIECPTFFSSKSLNTFMLYKKQGKTKEFMSDYMAGSTIFARSIFDSYITDISDLSVKQTLRSVDQRTGVINEPIENPLYWRRPENYEKAVMAMAELSVLYNPRK